MKKVIFSAITMLAFVGSGMASDTAEKDIIIADKPIIIFFSIQTLLIPMAKIKGVKIELLKTTCINLLKILSPPSYLLHALTVILLPIIK